MISYCNNIISFVLVFFFLKQNFIFVSKLCLTQKISWSKYRSVAGNVTMIYRLSSKLPSSVRTLSFSFTRTRSLFVIIACETRIMDVWQYEQPRSGVLQVSVPVWREIYIYRKDRVVVCRSRCRQCRQWCRCYIVIPTGAEAGYIRDTFVHYAVSMRMLHSLQH